MVLWPKFVHILHRECESPPPNTILNELCRHTVSCLCSRICRRPRTIQYLRSILRCRIAGGRSPEAHLNSSSNQISNYGTNSNTNGVKLCVMWASCPQRGGAWTDESCEFGVKGDDSVGHLMVHLPYYVIIHLSVSGGRRAFCLYNCPFLDTTD